MKKQTIAPIEQNDVVAPQMAVLRTLTEAEQSAEHEIDSVRVEDFLLKRPKDPRAPELRARVKRNRARATTNVDPPSASDAPAAVIAALQLLRGTRPARLSAQARIEQIDNDLAVLREGRMAQQAVVDAIKAELSHQLAKRLQADHRALVLAQFRALQALAATTDAERLFRATVTNAGYLWREDLLPAPVLRSALIAGSEAEHDSEVSRTRRLLEEWKIVGG
jgi:hypothetical protein